MLQLLDRQLKRFLVIVALILALLALSSPAWATWKIVQQSASSACTATNSACSVTVTITGAGNLIVVVMSIASNAETITSVTDNATGGSATYTHASSCNGTDSNNKGTDCAYVLSSKSGATSITVNRTDATSHVWRIQATEVSYTAGSISVDTQGTRDQTTSVTNPAGVTLTLTGTNDAIFQFIQGTTPSTIGSSYTSVVGGNQGSAYLLNTLSGTAPTWTQLSGPAALSAIAFTESNTHVSFVGSAQHHGSMPQTVTYSPTAGDPVIVAMTIGASATVTSVSCQDNNSNALTAGPSATNTNGTSIVDVFLFYGSAVSGATSYQCTLVGTDGAADTIQIGEYKCDTGYTCHFDASPSGNTGTGSVSPVTITATTGFANEWIIDGMSAVNQTITQTDGVQRQIQSLNPQTILSDIDATTTSTALKIAGTITNTVWSSASMGIYATQNSSGNCAACDLSQLAWPEPDFLTY